MPKEWSELGAGSYNTAYKSADGKSVLKIQRIHAATDTPIRSVRLWNEINPDLPPPATIQEVEELDHKVGWVCPFVEGVQASDEEIHEKLINIFNNTGRIIVDALSPKNFIKTPDNQIVCVDIGMALQIDKREEVLVKQQTRRGSVVSTSAWSSTQSDYGPYFEISQKIFPNATNTVKALLFIKSTRPDIFDVSFLKQNPQLLELLAKAKDGQNAWDALFELDKTKALLFIKENNLDDLFFDENFLNQNQELMERMSLAHDGLNVQEVLAELEEMAQSMEDSLILPPPPPPPPPEEVQQAKQVLDEERPVTLENIKESCINELERYIKSRNLVTFEGAFQPAWLTKIYKEGISTAQAVEGAHKMIDAIDSAETLEEMREYLQKANLECAGKCQVIVDIAAESNPELLIQSGVQASL